MTGFWFRDFLGLGALLGLWGGLLLFRRDRFMASFLVVAALATVISVTWMQNFEPGREWLWVMRVFLLPAELFTALGIACALAWGAEKTPRLRAFLGGLAVAMLLMSLASTAPNSSAWIHLCGGLRPQYSGNPARKGHLRARARIIRRSRSCTFRR